MKKITIKIREWQKHKSNHAMAKLMAAKKAKLRKKSKNKKSKTKNLKKLTITPPKELKFHGNIEDRRAFFAFINRVEG